MATSFGASNTAAAAAIKKDPNLEIQSYDGLRKKMRFCSNSLVLYKKIQFLPTPSAHNSGFTIRAVSTVCIFSTPPFLFS